MIAGLIVQSNRKVRGAQLQLTLFPAECAHSWLLQVRRARAKRSKQDRGQPRSAPQPSPQHTYWAGNGTFWP